MIDVYAMENGHPVKTEEIGADVWINMVNPTAEEIDLVQRTLGIDREALTAALDDEEGSRTEATPEYTLILIDAPVREWRNGREEFATYPLSITVTDTAIVTVSLMDLFAVSNMFSGKAKNASAVNFCNRPRFVLQILYRVAMSYQADLKYIEVKRMAIEESIRKATRWDDLFELHELESNLVYFKTSLSVNASIVERMGKQSRFVSSEDDRELLDDVQIETSQALEMTDTYSQIIKGTRQLVESDLNNSLAIVMKFLTIITLVLSIPTMMFSYYGMNIQLPLSEYDHMWLLIIGITTALCILVMLFLRRGGLWRRSAATERYKCQSRRWQRPSGPSPESRGRTRYTR